MANRHYENTARVLAVTVAFFGGLIAIAYVNGVFARLGPELTATLAIFAVAFAGLTWHLDPGVRAFAKRLFAARDTVAKADTKKFA